MIVYPVQRSRGPHHHLAPAPVPVSLAPVRLVEVTDAEIGLQPNPWAQVEAERQVRHAIAVRQREEADRRIARERLMPGPTVHAEVPDDALALIQPTDRLTEDERATLAELRRMVARPPAQWRVEAHQDDDNAIRAASKARTSWIGPA